MEERNGFNPALFQILLNASILGVSGLAFHCRWFLVNMAKAVAPIERAFSGGILHTAAGADMGPDSFHGLLVNSRKWIG